MKKKQKINYNAFLPIGIVFMGAGVVFMTSVNFGVGIGLLVLGLAYIIISLTKRKKK